MKVLGLLSRKGGVGKSTLAIHLAVLAQAAGRRTLLVDLDPQRTVAGWWQSRETDTPMLAETNPGGLQAILDAARGDGVDLAVIDTRPSVEADATHVAALADLVLVPTRPVIFDLRAILATLDLVRAGRALIALNACPPRRGAGEAAIVSDARAALTAFGVPVAAVPIVYRAAFPSAAVDGLTVGEADPGSKAAKEMSALWREVEKELKFDGKAKSGKRPDAKAGPTGTARAGGRS
jgi:chromosome partitioning protein